MNQLKVISLNNKHGMSVEIINFGARVKSIKFPVNGKAIEMTVTYPLKEDYLNDSFYLGATCGRVCNRISGSKFELEDKHYQLTNNDGNNCLHGGVDNFSFRYWKIDNGSITPSSVSLRLTSNDSDQGFPGTIKVSVTYELTDENKLVVQYFANTDKSTPINLTNHSYFTLGEDNCESLLLKVNASSFLELNDTNLPTGKILSVNASDFNFKTFESIGRKQQETLDPLLIKMKGYDHCFVFDPSPLKQAKAQLVSLENKICMTMYTDQPALQLYTGAYLSGQFKAYQGVCLEAQNYPDAVNFKHFPNSILKADETYNRTIIFGFEKYNSHT